MRTYPRSPLTPYVRVVAQVLAHIKTAQQQGAQLLTGGGRPKELPKGYYVRPTIFDKVTRDMTLWQEEVFGPVRCVRARSGAKSGCRCVCCIQVLAITRFGSEEAAITMANDCKYGLGRFSRLSVPFARPARFQEASRTLACSCRRVLQVRSPACTHHGSVGDGDRLEQLQPAMLLPTPLGRPQADGFRQGPGRGRAVEVPGGEERCVVRGGCAAGLVRAVEAVGSVAAGVHRQERNSRGVRW